MTRPSRYNWLTKRAAKALEPGHAYQSFRGQDYECLSVSFAGQVYKMAAQVGLKATCAVFEDTVVFAFYHPGDYLRPNMSAYPVVKKIRGTR